MKPTDFASSHRLLVLWLVAGVLLCGSTPTWGSGPNGCSGPTLRVGIDIGHSQRAPGAISATGRTEYYFNDRFARELVARSRRTEGSAKVELFIVNPEGAELSLPQRPELARRHGADIFISIHHDSAHRKYFKPYLLESRLHHQTPDIHGFSLFVSRTNPKFEDSRQLAHLVGTSFRIAGMQPTLHHAENLPNERREILEQRIGLYEAPFAVLRSARIPALLIEVGVIANRAEEADLERPEARGRVQLALMEALGAFCDGRDRLSAH